MGRHRTHGIAFKRQIVQEHLEAATTILDCEARIAALKRPGGKQAAELEFPKEAQRQRRRRKPSASGRAAPVPNAT